MNGPEMMRSLEALLEGGEGASTLLACDQQGATDFRAFCYRRGVPVEVQKEASGVYRFTRTSEKVGSVRA